MSEITRNEAIRIVEDIRTAISAGSVTNTMEAQVLEYCVVVLGRSIEEASQSGSIVNLPDVVAFLAGISSSTTLRELLSDITGKIPSEASSANKLADKAFVTTAINGLQNALNNINTNIGNGYVYAGIATPSVTPVSGKVFYLAKQAGRYTNFGGLTVTEGINILKRNGSAWSQEQLMSMADIYKNPLIGYYECDTAGDTAAKAVTAAGYVLPATGGSVKIKMANRNTVANATLDINSTGAKPLYYNGQRASAGNTWDTNEIIEVFYDGTNYQAHNVAGSNVDGVFDISAYNLTDGQPTPYENLEAALGPDGDNVPPSFRKGGMSIKFVQSPDNKYVQYRLMVDSFSTTKSDWQGVDGKPIAGSHNIVESDGVANDIIDINLRTFGKTENIFSASSVREDYSFNSTNGKIVQPSNGKYVITNYIKLPNEWSSVVYSGVVTSGAIRARFSDTVDDNEEGVLIAMKQDGLEYSIKNSQTLAEKKYVVLTVYRGASDSTPSLSNVSIKFLYDTNLVKEVDELSLSVGEMSEEVTEMSEEVGELSEEVTELHTVVDGTTTVPQFNIGFINSSDGTLSPATSSVYRYSDAIAVIPGLKVNINNVSGSSSTFTVALYQTENGNADLTLSKKGTSQNANYTDFEIPEGIYFIRLGYNTGSLPEGSSCNISTDGQLTKLQEEVEEIGANIENIKSVIIEHDTIIHTPSVSPRKAAIAFQLDWASLAQNNVLDYASLLAEHGIKKSTYFILPNRATAAYGLDKMLAIQDLGNEIGLHSDTQHYIAPTDPAVTPSDMRTYIADWLSQMYAKGFKNLPGMVCRTAKVQEALIPVINEYFSYRTGVSSGAIDYNAHDTSTFIGCVNSLETDSRCPKRLGLELTTELQTTEDEDIVIANTKTAIDTAIATKGYLVIYGHTYNELSAEYTITERVLNEILDYVLAKIISGDVVVGGTSEILNYYYSKRNYEQ